MRCLTVSFGVAAALALTAAGNAVDCAYFWFLSKTYVNPQDRQFQPILDSDAFGTCP